MSALTLVEAAKIAADNGETKKAGVISLYAENSDIMSAMRFEGIMGNAITFTQEGDLPTTAFRGVNEAYTASNGKFNPQKEALYIAGGDLDVDKFIIKTQGMEVRSKHEALKVKALSQAITDTVLKGDNSSDPREFDGFQVRCTGDQLIAAGSTASGTALSLAKLDQLIDSVDSPTHLVMSPALRRRFMAAFRSSTFPNITQTKDDVGRMVIQYGDLPILVGYPKNKNTAILPFEEACTSGSALGTSIYCVNFSENGVVGISNGGIDVRDLGELDTAPVWRTRVEWYLGLMVQSPYSIARLYSIADAAITA